MKKTIKKYIAFLLVALTLFGSTTVAFAGGDGPYGFLENISSGTADEYYNNGKKFILFVYDPECSDCLSVWNHIDRSWHTPYYSQIDMFGVENGYPTFMCNDIGGSVSLPVVIFVENGQATYYQGLTSTDVLDEKFYSFYDEIVPVEGASISKTSLELSVGQKEQLTVTVYPTNATQKKLKWWTSSDYSVADVNSSGVVTAKKAGTAVVSIKTYDGNFEVSCTVTVFDVPSTHTLYYDANGGTGAPSAQTGATSYTVSSVKPSRTGYTFCGWSENSLATSASYVAGDTVAFESDTTLYAVWQKNEVVEITCENCGETFTDEATYNEHIANCEAESEGGFFAKIWNWLISIIEFLLNPIKNIF